MKDRYSLGFIEGLKWALKLAEKMKMIELVEQLKKDIINENGKIPY